MAIAVAGTGAIARNTSAATTLNVPIPAGSVGDVAEVHIALGSDAAFTEPAGWTLLASLAGGTLTLRTVGLLRVLDGTEGSTLAVTTASTTSAGVCRRYSGVDNTTPLDVPVTTVVNTANAGTSELPALNAGTAGRALVVGGGFDDTGETGTLPAGWTRYADFSTGKCGIAGDKLGQSGASEGVTITWSRERRNSAYLLALRPASSGTTFTQSTAGTTTPAGSLARRPARGLSGSLTAAAGLLRELRRAVAGGTAPAGAASRRTGRSASGATTPTGAVATVRTRLLTLAGAVAPSGTAARLVERGAAGTVAAAGSTSRRTARATAGASTPTGSVAATRTLLLNLAGTLTPAGAVARFTARASAGALTAVGTAAHLLARTLSGSVAPAGALSASATDAGFLCQDLTGAATAEALTGAQAVESHQGAVTVEALAGTGAVESYSGAQAVEAHSGATAVEALAGAVAAESYSGDVSVCGR